MRTFQRISRLIRPAVALPVLAGLALAGLLVLALGCGEERQPPASTASAMSPRLPDVPVPAGFKFKPDKSGDRISGGLRVVEHLYEGDEPLRRVSEFYRTMMPPIGWTQKEETLNAGRQRFQFEKGNEVCYVSVYDDWGTKVLIQVFPKGTRPFEPAPAGGGPAAVPAPPAAPAPGATR